MPHFIFWSRFPHFLSKQYFMKFMIQISERNREIMVFSWIFVALLCRLLKMKNWKKNKTNLFDFHDLWNRRHFQEKTHFWEHDSILFWNAANLHFKNDRNNRHQAAYFQKKRSPGSIFFVVLYFAAMNIFEIFHSFFCNFYN